MKNRLVAAIFAAFAVFVAGVLTVDGAAQAQSSGIASHWTGEYQYPNQSQGPVEFTMTLQLNGQSITGRTTEPATFGNGSSPFLYATISGTVVGRTISFTKTYDGTGGVNHSVQYRGTISRDGSFIVGRWNIGNDGAAFSATAQAP
jgi:hypothetical protein